MDTACKGDGWAFVMGFGRGRVHGCMWSARAWCARCSIGRVGVGLITPLRPCAPVCVRVCVCMCECVCVCACTMCPHACYLAAPIQSARGAGLFAFQVAV